MGNDQRGGVNYMSLNDGRSSAGALSTLDALHQHGHSVQPVAKRNSRNYSRRDPSNGVVWT